MKNIFSKIGIFIAVMAMLAVPFFTIAESDGKVTLCHVTGSESNPYVLITISVNALDAHFNLGDFYPRPGGVCEIIGPF